jgi:hypothetical protein
MEMVSAVLRHLARGNFGALKRLNVHTFEVFGTRLGLGLPADIGWAIPPLEVINLVYAPTWFAANVMRVARARKLALEPMFPDSLRPFDLLGFLLEVPSLDIETMVVDLSKAGRDVRNLYTARGIRLVACKQNKFPSTD